MTTPAKPDPLTTKAPAGYSRTMELLDLTRKAQGKAGPNQPPPPKGWNVHRKLIVQKLVDEKVLTLAKGRVWTPTGSWGAARERAHVLFAADRSVALLTAKTS